ncbi:hypothetical protein J6590_013054 [Homalodisca vitripennis]|nr:hypothetical protein J6590_013054 [Homalodisca vitripennis]
MYASALLLLLSEPDVPINKYQVRIKLDISEIRVSRQGENQPYNVQLNTTSNFVNVGRAGLRELKQHQSAPLFTVVLPLASLRELNSLAEY